MVGASEPVHPGELYAAYIHDAQHLHMTGINFEALETASRLAKKTGKTISFDPGRSKSEQGYKKLAPVLKYVDYLLVNRREARVLLGEANDPNILEVAKKLKRRIGEEKTYVVKGGSNDILVYSPEGNFSVSPFKIKVVDTIGAGDAFDAGFLTALLRGRDLADAVVYGAASGSLKCTREGAQSAPDKLDLEDFLRKNSDTVKVTKLP
jgi:sugar/nucleoside kinase (ribokinase family)